MRNKLLILYRSSRLELEVFDLKIATHPPNSRIQFISPFLFMSFIAQHTPLYDTIMQSFINDGALTRALEQRQLMLREHIQFVSYTLWRISVPC